MADAWSWKRKQYGLQRLKYSGNPVFEMLAIHARPAGFEIEFTKPLSSAIGIKKDDFLLQQWWYLSIAPGSPWVKGRTPGLFIYT